MKIPSKGKTEMYDISDTEYASVELEESTNKFWLTIWRIEKPVEKDENMVKLRDSNALWFDTFEEVQEYLVDKAEGKYKDQFQA